MGPSVSVPTEPTPPVYIAPRRTALLTGPPVGYSCHGWSPIVSQKGVELERFMQLREITIIKGKNLGF